MPPTFPPRPLHCFIASARVPLALILLTGCSDPGPAGPEQAAAGMAGAAIVSPSAGAPAASAGTATGGGVAAAGMAGSVAAGGLSGAGGGVAAAGGGAAGAAGEPAGMAGMGGGGNVPEGELRVYWIDVEGGAATLLVAPAGETMLIDAGWQQGGRDADRILAALDAEIGEPRVDYLIGTHYHVDHVTGVLELVQRASVGEFIDHGVSAEGQGGDFANWMEAVGEGTRRSVVVGDTVQLGSVEVTIVAASGDVIDPLPTAIPDNPECLSSEMVEDVLDEDPQSIGILARFGSFDFVALGDLTWGVEHQLACPTNRIGQIDLFQVSQHGSDESNPPQLIRSLAPLAAVSNNGARKGGAARTFETLFETPSIEGVWQLHRVLNNDAEHNTEPALIANDDGAPDGQYVYAVVQGDGSFSIINSRNGETREYSSR